MSIHNLGKTGKPSRHVADLHRGASWPVSAGPGTENPGVVGSTPTLPIPWSEHSGRPGSFAPAGGCGPQNSSPPAGVHAWMHRGPGHPEPRRSGSNGGAFPPPGSGGPPSGGEGRRALNSPLLILYRGFQGGESGAGVGRGPGIGSRHGLQIRAIRTYLMGMRCDDRKTPARSGAARTAIGSGSGRVGIRCCGGGRRHAGDRPGPAGCVTGPGRGRPGRPRAAPARRGSARPAPP
jgi:hypothetical protein